jgi:hypothetical protein
VFVSAALDDEDVDAIFADVRRIMGKIHCRLRTPTRITLDRVSAGTLGVPVIVLLLFEDQENTVPIGIPAQIEKATRIISEVGNIQK